MRGITHSCDTSSAHCWLDWLIYVLKKDKGSDVGVTGDAQAIHCTIDSIFVSWPHAKFSPVCNAASRWNLQISHRKIVEYDQHLTRYQYAAKMSQYLWSIELSCESS